MPASTPVAQVSFRAALDDAVHYWEPRRLVYNLALLIVVAGAYVGGLPLSKQVVAAESALVLFILAVLANVAYCAAYLPDLALQLTTLRATWLRGRWLLMAVGTLMACALAWLLVGIPFGLIG